MNMKKLICLLLLVCAAFTLTIREDAPAETETAVPTIETGIKEIKKYGNLVLTVSPEAMIELGYEPADLVRVSVGGRTMEMPVGIAYSDVDTGEPVCCHQMGGVEVPQVSLAINMGDLASSLGIAVKTATAEAPGYRWDWCEGFDDAVTVTIAMVEKQGYADEYLLRQLSQNGSNDRADYPALTDADYANFREVDTTGMGIGALYRSSSPVNPKYNRNREADAAAEAAGIQTVMNMADNADAMRSYDGFSSTYYASCDVIALNMSMDFFSDDFRGSLAKGLRFLAARRGPYLIHCNLGKDRTGFAAGILECLMGAGPEEVVRDYMHTYENFYRVEAGTEQYDRVAVSNIERSLARAFGLESIWDESADLALCAERYLKDLGLTEDEIGALKAGLSADYSCPANQTPAEFLAAG